MVLSSYTYMLVIPDCMLCANAGWSDPDLAKMIRIRFLDLDPAKRIRIQYLDPDQ